MGSDAAIVPDWCAKIQPECPVEGTVYGYYPTLWINAFFAAFFGLCAIMQLALGIRYKTWTYMIALVLGSAGESAGYIGRVLMHSNPWDKLAFQLQVVFLIFSPALLAAGIYLTLKHVVIVFGEGWSRLKPKYYTWIFICCDISSLLLQGGGGGMAATAKYGTTLLDVGTNIMITGIVWQVVILVAFGFVVVEYVVRTKHRYNLLSAEALQLWHNRPFRWFVFANIVAFVGIFVRCVYRIPELLEGWGGSLMRHELDFILLEGVMIAITVGAQTIFHPGFCFPALAGTITVKKNKKKGGSSHTESEMEMVVNHP